jgi:hypothetical protein
VRELGPRDAARAPAPRDAGIAPLNREPTLREPLRDTGPVEPVLPDLDFPAIGSDDIRGHGPGAREPSLHEPLPLAPSGDANLLHAPQSFGARDMPEADSRREPRFIAPEVPAVDPRDPAASRVRASVIDNGLPTPRLRSRADGSIPDLRARLRADAEAEAAETLQVPELRRESADPTAPRALEAAPELPAEPIYAWDPATEDTEPEAPIVVDEPPPRLLAEPDEPEAPRRVWPWVLGILVAALAFGAQAVWVWRDDIATNLPITRPLLNAVCAPLGCTVGYPRHPELLSIESSALEPWSDAGTNVTEPGTPSNRLALRVVLRNRHTLPQPWPSIELTLTDLSDAAVVRRVLAPSDYLPADTVAKPMPPRSERSLRVPVDPPSEAVSGYRLSVFFP